MNDFVINWILTISKHPTKFSFVSPQRIPRFMCVLSFFPLSISRIRVFSTKNKTYNETNIQNGNDYWASKNINEIHNGMNLSFVRQHKTDISFALR